MDRIIEHSGNKRKKIIWGIAALAIGVLLCSGYIFQRPSSKQADRKKMTTTTAKYQDFQEIISFSAITEPVNSVDISVIEGGRVQHIAVQNGDTVAQGQVLLILDNPDLTLEFMTKETHIIEQINNLRNARMLLENTRKADEDKLIDLQYEREKMDRKFATDTVLFQERVIAKNDYTETASARNYYEQKMQLLTKNIEQNRQYHTTQLAQIDASIALMQRNLAALKQHLQHLVVKAPFAGVLTQFDLDLGESVNKNQLIGKIEAPGNYKAIASIDEHYLQAVKEGQAGYFKLHGSNAAFTIAKIFPTVTNTTFKAEIVFDPALSAAMTKGQTLNAKLPISDNREALVIEKGEFYQQSAGAWAYVLKENKAEKRAIRLGKQNDTYYEVLSGLAPNETIINSSYASYEEVDELIVP